MVAVTVKAAKSRLDELVNRARDGEQIVLVKGSRRVASISPFFEDDAPLTITDAQAKRLIEESDRDNAEGRGKLFPNAEKAVEYLHRKLDIPVGRKRRRPK